MIRLNDHVRIEKPEFFVRCGYPMQLHVETKKILNDRGNELRRFAAQFGLHCTLHGGAPACIEKIAKALAFDMIRVAGFGGKNRDIYRVTVEDMLGKEFSVQGVRMVKTGIHSSGSVDQNGDYDPPFLANEKSHRIILTPFHNPNFGVDENFRGMNWEIEACNLSVIRAAPLRRKTLKAAIVGA